MSGPAPNTVAVVTAKQFSQAKQRMAESVGPELRRDLVEAMLGDVLEAVSGARMVGTALVVTGEPAAASLAESSGAEVVADPGGIGHPAASLLGIERARELGAETVILLPGDCPLLESRELDHLLTGVPSPFVTVVPDRHGTGTNALVLSPPDAIEPSFGEGSHRRHLDLAREAGVPGVTEEIAGLALDLDTPADIVALTTRLAAKPGGARRTAAVLGI
ncbi:MAG: 2-phospho-L-lactate guanylyltransferase [Solirubrobacterales bacterium]|nr:2-phospho-L-lactate guanylyltransferase [Solirubrobacterales bacterium]